MNLKWPNSLQMETPKHRQRSTAAVNHDGDSRAGPQAAGPGSSRRKGKTRRSRATPEDAAGPGMMYYQKGHAENLPKGNSETGNGQFAPDRRGKMKESRKKNESRNLSASKWFERC